MAKKRKDEESGVQLRQQTGTSSAMDNAVSLMANRGTKQSAQPAGGKGSSADPVKTVTMEGVQNKVVGVSGNWTDEEKKMIPNIVKYRNTMQNLKSPTQPTQTWGQNAKIGRQWSASDAAKTVTPKSDWTGLDGARNALSLSDTRLDGTRYKADADGFVTDVDIGSITSYDQALIYAAHMRTDEQRDDLLSAIKKQRGDKYSIADLRGMGENLYPGGVYDSTQYSYGTKNGYIVDAEKQQENEQAIRSAMDELGGLYDVNGRDIDASSADIVSVVQGIRGIADSGTRRKKYDALETLMKTPGSRFYGMELDPAIGEGFNENAQLTQSDYNALMDAFQEDLDPSDGHEADNIRAYYEAWHEINDDETASAYRKRQLSDGLQRTWLSVTGHAAPDMKDVEDFITAEDAREAAEQAQEDETEERKPGIWDRLLGLFGFEKSDRVEDESPSPSPSKPIKLNERQAVTNFANTVTQLPSVGSKEEYVEQGVAARQAEVQGPVYRPKALEAVTGEEVAEGGTDLTGDVYLAAVYAMEGRADELTAETRDAVDRLASDPAIGAMLGVLSGENFSRFGTINGAGEVSEKGNELASSIYRDNYAILGRTMSGYALDAANADFPAELRADAMGVMGGIIKDAQSEAARDTSGDYDPLYSNIYDVYLEKHPEATQALDDAFAYVDEITAQREEAARKAEEEAAAESQKALETARAAVRTGSATDAQWQMVADEAPVLTKYERLSDEGFRDIQAQITLSRTLSDGAGDDDWYNRQTASYLRENNLPVDMTTVAAGQYKDLLKAYVLDAAEQDMDVAYALGFDSLSAYYDATGTGSMELLEKRGLLAMQRANQTDEADAQIAAEAEASWNGTGEAGTLEVLGTGVQSGANTWLSDNLTAIYDMAQATNIEVDADRMRATYIGQYGLAEAATRYKQDVLAMAEQGLIPDEKLTQYVTEYLNKGGDPFKLGFVPEDMGFVRENALKAQARGELLSTLAQTRFTPGQGKVYDITANTTTNVLNRGVALAAGMMLPGSGGTTQLLSGMLGYGASSYVEAFDENLGEHSLKGANAMGLTRALAISLANLGTDSDMVSRLSRSVGATDAVMLGTEALGPVRSVNLFKASAKAAIKSAAKDIAGEVVHDELAEGIYSSALESGVSSLLESTNELERLPKPSEMLKAVADTVRGADISGSMQDMIRNAPKNFIYTLPLSLFGGAVDGVKTWKSVKAAVRASTTGSASDGAAMMDAISEDMADPAKADALDRAVRQAAQDVQTADILMQDEGEIGNHMDAAGEAGRQAQAHGEELAKSKERMGQAQNTYAEHAQAIDSGSVDPQDAVMANAAADEIVKAQQGIDEHRREAEQQRKKTAEELAEASRLAQAEAARRVQEEQTRAAQEIAQNTQEVATNTQEVATNTQEIAQNVQEIAQTQHSGENIAQTQRAQESASSAQEAARTHSVGLQTQSETLQTQNGAVQPMRSDVQPTIQAAMTTPASAQSGTGATHAKVSPMRATKRLAQALGIGQAVGTRKMAAETTGGARNLPKNVRGYFNTAAKYIAVRGADAGNIRVDMHEIGHAIADRIGMTGTQQMVDNLDGVFHENYSAEELPGEAFAEWAWRYMVSDDAANAFAGEAFTRSAEQAMRRNGIYRDVKRAQKDIRNYVNASVFEKIGTVVRDKSEQADDRGVKDRIQDSMRTFITNMVDSTRPAEDVNSAVRAQHQGKLEETMNLRHSALIRGTASKRAWNILTEHLTDVQGTIIGDSLAERLARSGIRGRDFDMLCRYMLAKHSIDRDRQMKPVFDSDTIPRGERETFIEDVERNHQEVARAEEAFQSFRHDVMQAYMVDTGFLTQDALDLFERLYPHYVPTYRVQDRGGNGVGGGQTYTVRRAVGSTQDIINPMDSFVDMVNAMVAQGLQNEVAKTWDRVYRSNEGMGVFGREITQDMQRVEVSLDEVQKQLKEALAGSDSEDLFEKLCDAMGDSAVEYHGTGTVNLPNVVTVRLEDGTRRYYEMFDPELYDVIAGTTDGGKTGFDVIGRLTRGMSALTTGSNPIFGIRNFMRDFQSSVSYGSWASNYATGLFKWLSAAWDVFREGGDYAQYKALGGGGWTRVETGSTKGAEDYRGALFKGYNTATAGRTVKTIGRTLWNVATMERLNEVIEQASRYAEYKYGKHDTSSPEGRQEAYLAAQDVTVDFSRRGKAVEASALRQLIPFFNASVQGIYRTGRMGTQAERDRLGARFTKTVLNTALMSALASGLLLGALDDEDKEAFFSLSDDLKSKHLYLPNPAPDVFGNAPLLRIPLGQDPLMYAVHGLVTNAMWSGHGDEWAIEMSAVAQTILDNLNPVSSTILDPAISMMTNKNWYGSNIVPRSMENVYPTAQYTETTPTLFVEASRMLDTATGGRVSVSPMMLQYLAQQYSGFVGQIGLPFISRDKEGQMEGVDAVIGKIRDTITSDPLKSNDVVSGVYDGFTFLQNITATAKKGKAVDVLRHDLTEKEAKAAYDEAYKLTHTGGELYEAKKQITACYDRFDEIDGRTDLSEDEKYRMTSEIRREMIDIALSANERIGEYRRRYVDGESFWERLLTGGAVLPAGK